ncbi:PDZ and LIM domain protein 4-like isoform X1 [Petaurus breviceps papuanus]|uniref:PDZ and LIM domain protein 4-like isoform X1 n=1 Tax=Petaurus breviceps papuanus TaxID=3040969 RepID=UPI0036DE1B9A
MSQRIWRINPGSKAVLANLCPGDVIQAINGEDVDSMTHLEAQNKIKACLDQLMLSVNRFSTLHLQMTSQTECQPLSKTMIHHPCTLATDPAP